ncbi:hypothetical protein SDC9_30413 [bioreactor metagenome]|uniref:Uncharacterized protein n=1 Tax=bioreactor metagenome TaxID=1076179 RepID=A0A644UZF0_9ZZZZ
MPLHRRETGPVQDALQGPRKGVERRLGRGFRAPFPVEGLLR